MNFEQTVKFLFGRQNHKKSSLALVKKTAENMGLFPLGFKVVHIAGTNGKGTAACALGTILKEAGFKSGVFTSPHIKTPLERIKINEVLISEPDFAKAVSFVKKKQAGELNFFETLTLAALFHFKSKKIDIAVLECGIGGLLDSTNIVDADICLITSVDLDHCSMLGGSLKEIAVQKSGIIKGNSFVLCGPMGKEARSEIAKAVEKAGAKLIKTGRVKNLRQNFKKLESSFDFEGETYLTKIMGAAQSGNIALAIKAAGLLGVRVEKSKSALAGFAMPCRFEVIKIKRGKYLIKDGAHNPAAFKEFIKTYKNSRFYKPDNTLILACSQGHDYKKLCAIAEKSFDNIVLVCPNEERNMKTENLLNCFNKSVKVSVLRDIYSFNPSGFRGNVIAGGSFYLAAVLEYRAA